VLSVCYYHQSPVTVWLWQRMGDKQRIETVIATP